MRGCAISTRGYLKENDRIAIENKRKIFLTKSQRRLKLGFDAVDAKIVN